MLKAFSGPRLPSRQPAPRTRPASSALPPLPYGPATASVRQRYHSRTAPVPRPYRPAPLPYGPRGAPVPLSGSFQGAAPGPDSVSDFLLDPVVSHGVHIMPVINSSGCRTFLTNTAPGPVVINCGISRTSIRTSDRQPNGVWEVWCLKPGKSGRSSSPGGVARRVTYAFPCARAVAPTCEYLLPEAARSTFLPRLSSPENRPDLRKRHSEDAILVLPWIATEGVPVT